MIATLSAALALATQAAPAAMTPAGSWEMDGRTGCTLTRRFDSADGQITLGLKRYPGSSAGELVFVMPGKLNRRVVGDGRVVLGEATSFPVVWTLVPVYGQNYHGATVQPDDAFWSALRGATEMTVDVGDRRKVRLAVGPMANAANALDECRQGKAVAAR